MQKKVLFLITKSGFGGAGKYVYDLATHLPGEYEPIVAAGGNGHLFEKLHEKDIRTITIPDLERDISLFKEFRVFFFLIGLFLRERPAVIHLNSSKIGGIGSLAGRIAGVPRIVYTAHGWAFNEQHHNFFWRAFAWISSLATAVLVHRIIAVSKYDLVRSPLKGKTILVHNGVEQFMVLPRDKARADLTLKARNVNGMAWIGTIAELTPNKGLTYLIDAVAEIPNVALFIISDGELRDVLAQQIKIRKLADRIFLMGAIPDARKYLEAFDIVVLPSLKEGLPYIILEAGIAGRAVVASNVGGIPEIIENEKTGLLIPARNSVALATTFAQLIADEDLRSKLGSALKSKVEKEFSLENMCRGTIQVYEN